MPLSEFEIIDKYFSRPPVRRDIIQSVGDDCALVSVPADQLLAVSIDTLIEGVHFPASVTPADLAYKAVAINLSDLAAAGAEPAWLTVAITIPEANEPWLEDFCHQLYVVSEHFGVEVIGGDTTRGNLSITIQAHGLVPPNMSTTRSGAKVGDMIYVTGFLGDAGIGLSIAQNQVEVTHEGDRDYLLSRLHRPQPRVAVGLALRGVASSAIDISDGMAADLGHILKASGVGAQIDLEKIPLSDALRNAVEWNRAIRYAVSAGDDYELCFTIPKEEQERMEVRLANTGCPYQFIGRIVSKPGLRLMHQGEQLKLDSIGYRHF